MRAQSCASCHLVNEAAVLWAKTFMKYCLNLCSFRVTLFKLTYILTWKLFENLTSSKWSVTLPNVTAVQVWYMHLAPVSWMGLPIFNLYGCLHKASTLKLPSFCWLVPKHHSYIFWVFPTPMRNSKINHWKPEETVQLHLPRWKYLCDLKYL